MDIRGAAAAVAVGIAAIVTLMVGSCGRRASDTRPDGAVRIVVSIPPLKGIVETLAAELGADVTVDLMVPVGAMEHGFEIPPSMVSKLAQADLVVYVGLGLEPQVEQILREKRVYRQEVCFADVVGIKQDDGHGHSHSHDHDHDHDHDHGHSHDHGAIDPHLWLDPSLMVKLVPAVSAALATVADGVGNEAAATRLRDDSGPVWSLQQRVAEVDAAYEDRLRPLRGSVVITAHAAWGRMTERYGLEQAALSGLEANEPSTAAIARAVELVREKKAGAVFSEPQVSMDALNRIADVSGVKIFQLDPLGGGDWFKMMRTNLDTLAAGLGQRP